MTKTANLQNAKQRKASFLKKAANKGVVQIELPPKLVPIFTGIARYRGAYGGRGSGKTRSFAKMAAIRGYQLAQAGKTGLIITGREFMNTLADSSLAEVKQAILTTPWLAAHYDIGKNYIRTNDGRISFAFIGLRRSLDSLKSKAHIHLLWIDEAEHVSEAAWQKAIPTVREPESEIWITWNPERKNSATHKRFRQKRPHEAKIVELNWRDNPWFPAVLDKERQEDLRNRPDSYAHIWEGDFITLTEGAYYAKAIQQAHIDERIKALTCDPLMPCFAFWDIGGTGARSDATAIWVAQFIGKKIYVLDYYEAQGQPLEAHVDWLSHHGFEQARMILPHDGSTRDRVHDVSFESALRQHGFDVEVIPNQGAGASRLRIEAARRLFSRIYFDKEKCAAGIDALQAYHEKRDTSRNIGLGPEHDWSSHAADAFGLMCIAYEEPQNKNTNRYKSSFYNKASWMAG